MSDLQTLMDKIEQFAGKQLPDDCHVLVADYVRRVIDVAIADLAAAQKRIERINQLPAKWEKDAGEEWGDPEDDERAYRIMRCRNDLLKALKDDKQENG